MEKYITYSLVVIFAFMPAILWLIIWYKKDNKEPEPKKLILKSFMFGILGIIPFLGLRHVMNYTPTLDEFWLIFQQKTFYLATISATFLFAFLEESVKHFAVLRLGRSLKIEFSQIVDGIIYSVSAALGFAFAENVYYFINVAMFTGFTPDFWYIYIFRSFGTMLGHSIFSGIFGFFWGYAIFSKKIAPKHTKSLSLFWVRFFETIRFHIIFSHILRDRPSKRGHEKRELVAEALLLATIVHTIFNLLLKIELFGHSLTPLVVPLLILNLIWLSKVFSEKQNIKIWKKAI